MIRTVQHFFKLLIDFFYPLVKRWMPKQLFRYAFCGTFALGVDIVVFFITYNFIFQKKVVTLFGFAMEPYTAAIIVAFLISFPIGFFLQKFITFTNSNLRGRVQLFRYLLLVMVCLALNYYGIKLLVEQYNVYPTLAKIITTIVVVIFSYFSQRYFTFKSIPTSKNN